MSSYRTLVGMLDAERLQRPLSSRCRRIKADLRLQRDGLVQLGLLNYFFLHI